MLRRLIDRVSPRKGAPASSTDATVDAMRKDLAGDVATAIEELDNYLERAPKEAEDLKRKAALAHARTTYSLAVAWQMDGDVTKALQECEDGLAMVEQIPSADEERRKFRALREKLRAALRGNG